MLIHSKIEATDVFGVHIKSTLKQTNKKRKVCFPFSIEKVPPFGGQDFQPNRYWICTSQFPKMRGPGGPGGGSKALEYLKGHKSQGLLFKDVL